MSNTGLWDEYGRFVTSQGSFDFTIDADSGTGEIVNNGGTANWLGGAGITTSVAPTNTITIDHVWDYEEILGSSGAFDIDLTAISGYTSAKSMVISFGLRGVVASTVDSVTIQINAGTTATDYHLQRVDAQDGVASTTEANSNANIVANIPANSSPSGDFAVGRMVCDVLLKTNMNKVFTVEAFGRNDTLVYRTTNSGFSYANTSAITSIRVRTDNHPTDLFATGSFVRVMFIR